MEEDKIITSGHGREASGEGSREKGLGLRKKAGTWLDAKLAPVLNSKVGENDRLSWGLILLIAVAVYAVYIIVKNVLYFFS